MSEIPEQPRKNTREHQFSDSHEPFVAHLPADPSGLGGDDGERDDPYAPPCPSRRGGERRGYWLACALACPALCFAAPRALTQSTCTARPQAFLGAPRLLLNRAQAPARCAMRMSAASRSSEWQSAVDEATGAQVGEPSALRTDTFSLATLVCARLRECEHTWACVHMQ